MKGKVKKPPAANRVKQKNDVPEIGKGVRRGVTESIQKSVLTPPCWQG